MINSSNFFFKLVELYVNQYHIVYVVHDIISHISKIVSKFSQKSIPPPPSHKKKDTKKHEEIETNKIK